MKKLIAPAIVVFMAMAGMQVQAQTTVAEVKKENKADEKELKKDVRSVKRNTTGSRYQLFCVLN